MKWQGAAVTAVWVCAFAAAGGLGAWSLANADISTRNTRAVPLDDDGVQQRLAAARAAAKTPGASESASPSGTAQPSPGSSGPGASISPSAGGSSSTAAAHVGTVSVVGGSATAECRADGRVYLTVWSPASGYHMDTVLRGPSEVATIEFEPIDDGDDRTYAIRCADGRPKAVPVADHDSHDSHDADDDMDDDDDD